MSTPGYAVRPSPFHARTAAASLSNAWATWNGVTLPAHYGDPAREAAALVQSCGVSDLSALRSYDVTGDETLAFLDHLCAESLTPLRSGRAAVSLLCTDDGGILERVVLTPMGEGVRVTAPRPLFAWLSDAAEGFEVSLIDVSMHLARLSLIGPAAPRVLEALGMDALVLRPGQVASAALRRLQVECLRLPGPAPVFELTVHEQEGELLWDRALRTGSARPVGLEPWRAYRLVRGIVEPGLDFPCADAVDGPERGVSPFGLSAAWEARALKPGGFIGRLALERTPSSDRRVALLDLDIPEAAPALGEAAGGLIVSDAGEAVAHLARLTTWPVSGSVGGRVIASTVLPRILTTPGTDLTVALSGRRLAARVLGPEDFAATETRRPGV